MAIIRLLQDGDVNNKDDIFLFESINFFCLHNKIIMRRGYLPSIVPSIKRDAIHLLAHLDTLKFNGIGFTWRSKSIKV